MVKSLQKIVGGASLVLTGVVVVVAAADMRVKFWMVGSTPFFVQIIVTDSFRSIRTDYRSVKPGTDRIFRFPKNLPVRICTRW